MTIDKAFYLRQIDAWSSSQPEGTRLTPAEIEQFADHLYGNAAQLLPLQSEAKDRAFEALLDELKAIIDGWKGIANGEVAYRSLTPWETERLKYAIETIEAAEETNNNG